MRYSFYKPYTIYEQGKRPNQEDSIFPRHNEATSDDRLFILCDGMGGYERGELASSTICESLSSFLLSKPVFSERLLMEGLQYSLEKLVEKSKGISNRMGTTLAFLAFHDGGCLAAHIGDSRIYHIRPKDGKVMYVSHDHSLVNDLYDAGEITLEEMKTSPQRHVITRAIRGGEKGHLSQPEIKHISDIRAGDYFLLVSDGMLEHTDDDDLLRLLARQDIDDEGKMERLKDSTAGNADNHSAIIIHVAGVEDGEILKSCKEFGRLYSSDNSVSAGERKPESPELPQGSKLRDSLKSIDWWKVYFFVLCVVVVLLWLIIKK